MTGASSSFAESLREFVPFETKLRVPASRPGLVARTQLVGRLATAPPVVLVSAPAGYGKTTLVSQWAAGDERPVAWVSLSDGDNDPVVLCTYLALALDGLQPMASTSFAAIAMSGADLRTVVLPRLGRAFSALERPCVLILDDVHVLHTGAATAALRVLAAHVPAGSQLVLAGRREPALPIAGMTAGGGVLRLGEWDLAMSVEEAEQLLEAAGARVDALTSEALVARTEGWAAGLYLAALVLRSSGDASPAFTGADRSVSAYFRDEVLGTLPEEQVRFLLCTSVLERLTGPLCDALADRQDSAVVLDALSRSNLFVIPLDRRGEWFRYHHAFRDMLLAELRRRDGSSESSLRLRACAWLRAHRWLDEAIDQAVAAHDLTEATSLVWTAAPALVASGRTATVRGWLDACSVDDVVASPALCVIAAWCALTDGQGTVDAWLAEAERGGTDEVLPDGTPLRSALALLRALVGANGLASMRDDVITAFDLDLTGSPYRPIARLLEGVASFLLGDPVSARELLEDGLHLTGTRMPGPESQCLTQLAVMALDDGDWAQARTLVDRALRVVDAHGMSERPAQAALYAVAALVAAQRGASTDAVEMVKHASLLLESLTGVAPWLAVQARILLARTTLMVGDPGAARVLLDDAERLVARVPDAGSLPERCESIRTLLEADVMSVGIRITPLTPAEMRVLRFLPTHLSFAAIADELFVSRNTIKTQAIAIYRKLGVTSRSSAVETARGLGIIE